MTTPTAVAIDFETYSEAGFVETPEGWTCLPGASGNKKGLPIVGASVYVEHPTFRPLCLSYNLKDGTGKHRWVPGSPAPAPLCRHAQSGGLISGWNCGGFETKVWAWCVRNLGWPAMRPEQWRDTMARARAYALPGALAKAAEVLGTVEQKDKRGKALLDKFSIPRNPTKKDPRRRIRPEDEPEDFAALQDYCDQDVATELSVGEQIPDLSAEELENWLCDRRINDRGVQIDMDGVENCIAIIEQAHSHYNAELVELTGGAVQKASEVQKITGFIAAFGVHTDSLDEEHLTALLDRPDIPPIVRRILQIRAAIGSASVKKTFAMRNQVSADGRLHDLFTYHGARTGRVTGGGGDESGSGPQPTNLPNSAGVFVLECESCERQYGKHLTHCPWCSASAELSHQREWGIDSAELALETIRTRSLAYVEHIWGDAMLAVSGSLRGLFIAAPGHDLICSDYSAIEAVVIAEIAGESWRQEVFRTHGKIYEMSAAKVTGVTLESLLQFKEETGQHHASRKLGKVMELACLSPETQLLTNRGYVAIKDVSLSDRLWDGLEWVSHDGLIEKGVRSVVSLDGVRMTPNHLVLSGHSWQEARKLVSHESILSRALEIGSANLPWKESSMGRTADLRQSMFDVLAGRNLIKSRSVTSIWGNRLGVAYALGWLRRELEWISSTLSSFSVTLPCCRIQSIEGGYSIGLVRPSPVVIPRRQSSTTLTAEEEFLSVMSGDATKPLFSSTSFRLKGGTTPLWRWIEKIIVGDMSRGTYGLSLNRKIIQTKELSGKCNQESSNLSDVYDIANAGPRNRFTIKTRSGHLIVHNCGFQGWVGSMRAFGADEFMDEDGMKRSILSWRDASPAIVELWGGQQRNWKTEYYGVEGMFVLAVCNPGQAFEYRGIQFQMRGNVLFLRLLSGREMAYHRPMLYPSERRQGTYTISYEGWNSNPKNGPTGWLRMETWGGKLVENIVQATARDIQWFGIRALEAAGYPIVLHVYDEDVAEVPHGVGSIEEFEWIMSTMPPWAAGWPVKAKGGWRGRRYRK